MNFQDFQLHNLADGESYVITYCPLHACMQSIQSFCKIYIRNQEYCFQLCILITTQQFALKFVKNRALIIMYRIYFCVHHDDLLLLLPAAAPPHAGQQEEVANRAALMQIPGRSRNAPAVAATPVVVGKVPDFWVTLTKFAVDWSDAGNHNQQQQAQLVSDISYFPYSSSSQFFFGLMQILSRNLHAQRDDSTLQCFIKYICLTLLH